ncbi:MAG TPA: sugar ABC transporter permease, partial [Actinomycetes bacterium]
ERNNNFGMFAAGAVLAAIPTVVLFQILQRFIVGGLTTGAVKG